jgi:hypothetical protein
MTDSIRCSFRSLALLALAPTLLLGAAAACRRTQAPDSAPPSQGSTASPGAPQAEPDIAALREDVARLKRLTPSQSHAMQDVGYHYTNLWFAGLKANWPLATFYLDETRSHLKWAVRIIPKRKVSAGEVDLDGIREAFEGSYLADVQKAIEAKSVARFSEAYKSSLEGCYACHKASEKPYLRPQIPAHPEVQIVNFDPNAKWPQ